jgi:hypothetical protein
MAVKTMTSGCVSFVNDTWKMKRTAILAILLEHLLDLVANLTLGNLDIVLGAAVVVHEGQEAVISDIELFLCQFMLHPLVRRFLTNWNSVRLTLGTSMLWVDGERSSNFLPVKMSSATK